MQSLPIACVAALALTTSGVRSQVTFPETAEQAAEFIADSSVRVPGSVHDGDSHLTVEKDPELNSIEVEVRVDGELVGGAALTELNPQAEVFLATRVSVGQEVSVHLPGQDAPLLSMRVIDRFYHRGDVNNVGPYVSAPGFDDVVYLYDYLLGIGPAPTNMTAADVDANGVVDFADLVMLYNFVIGEGTPAFSNGVETILYPRRDMLANGSTMAVEITYMGAFGNGWGEVDTPPAPDDETVREIDEDGNPLTQEWLYPCTFRVHPGTATTYYYSMGTGYGPRNPQPGQELTGANCAMQFYYYCIGLIPTFPFFSMTRTPIGKCQFGKAINLVETRLDGSLLFQSQDKESDAYTNFFFDPADGELQVEHYNWNGPADAPGDWEGPAEDWPGWCN